MSGTGLAGILDSVGLGGVAGTSRSLRMDESYPDSLLDSASQGLVGKPVPRIDGPLKVAGRATYAAEYALDNLAHGVLVGTTIGAGKIVSVDADAVRGLPGVIDVVTDFDTFIQVPQQGGETEAPAQGVKQITYRGEIVAIVLAETFEAARDAARQLPITYEEKPGRYHFEALRDEAKEPPGDNIPAHSQQGDVDAAMADAAFTVDSTYTTPSQNSAAMEPHASIASWDEDGALTLYGAYQMPTSDAQQLAKALGIAADKCRIVASYVGGGFGSKLGIAPESVAAAVAAKKLGRPVKAVMHRQQVFEATVRRSNTEQRVRLGCDGQGRLTAIAHETLTSNLPGQGYFEPTGIATHFLYAGENRLNHARSGRAQPTALRLDARTGRGGRPARPRKRDGRARPRRRHRPDRAPPPQRPRQRSRKRTSRTPRARSPPASTKARGGSAGTRGARAAKANG